jgi:mRNA interferase MazF
MARLVKRGEIWMYRFGRPDKRRPVVILSRQAALDRLRTAVVAPITRTAFGIPSEVRIGPDQGLKTDSVVNLDHLYTVDKADLASYVGRLDGSLLRDVCDAVNIALGCV